MEKLQKIHWTDNLSIGNDSIDNDHKKLLEIYNELVDLIELDKYQGEITIILSKLTDYVLTHFEKEEEYMQKFEYPKLEEHAQCHRDYSYKVAMYNVDQLSENKPSAKELLMFIKKWWTEHIKESDMEYENYRSKINSDAIYASS